MDPLAITDFFRFSHIIVVAVGFGAAALADVHMLSRLHKRVDMNIITTLESCHRLVWAMLVLMWLTGAVMIFIRTGFQFENFTPKLFSKLATVAILTANAVMIGKFAMPVLMKARGKSLLTLPLGIKLKLAAMGAVSSASWIMAMAMGVSKVLAASGWLIFLAAIPVIYVGSVVLTIGVLSLVHLGMRVARQQDAADEATPIGFRSASAPRAMAAE